MADNDQLTFDFPESHYYRIGEVSELAGVEPYVLRFWESQFGALRPRRTSSGQRLYRTKDVELILKIKHLLHEKKYTIKGAKNFLKSQPKKRAEIDLLIDEVRSTLQSINNLLK